MNRLKDKVAIVTGGASGIARAGSELMALQGAAVAVADLNVKGAADVAQAIRASGGEAQPFSVDVRDSQSVQALVDDVVNRFGRVDILFHNAMSVPLVNNNDRRITELPDDIWHQIVDLVLTGTFLTAKYVARHMLNRRQGSIILTATTDALIGQAGIDGYTAAKGGVVAMTRSMAAGLSPDGIRINTICPGFVDTPHQAVFMSNSAERDKIERLHLMGVMSPEDIGHLAVYLASDEACRITGSIIAADSGYTAFKTPVDLTTVFQR